MSAWGPAKDQPSEPLWSLASFLGFWICILASILWYLWKFSVLSSFFHPWLLWKRHLSLEYRPWGAQMCLWGSGAQPKESQSSSNCQLSPFFGLRLDCGVLKGIFKRQRAGDQTHFSCSCTTNATANGQNSVPAGPLGLLPSSLVPESLPKAFSNVHGNICNLRARCESEMWFLWKMQLLILHWMDSMFWSVWSREDHSRAFISPVGWSLWCHGVYDKRKCSPEKILLFLFLVCNLLICINFLSVQSIIC